MSLNETAAHCPECGAEYRPGFEVCADDGTRLVPGPAPEAIPEPETIPSPREAPARFVELTALMATEARLLVGRLREDGIEAHLDSPGIVSWSSMGYEPTRESSLRVLVPEARLEEARAIARALAEG